MAFIDHYDFKRLEKWAILRGIKTARIDCRYTDLIANIYEHATMRTMSVKVHINTRYKTRGAHLSYIIQFNS